jgi:DNA anti-recombination protein RmuC
METETKQITKELKALNKNIRDRMDTITQVKEALKNAREDYEAAVNELSEYIDGLEQPKLEFQKGGQGG